MIYLDADFCINFSRYAIRKHACMALSVKKEMKIDYFFLFNLNLIERIDSGEMPIMLLISLLSLPISLNIKKKALRVVRRPYTFSIDSYSIR